MESLILNVHYKFSPMTNNTQQLCKCGKAGEISCPNDERCGNTQLPAEVLEAIKDNADKVYNKLDDLAHEQDSYDFGLPMFKRETGPIIEALTEYATKLHQASTLLKNVFTRYGEIHEWDRKIFNEIKSFLDGTK